MLGRLGCVTTIVALLMLAGITAPADAARKAIWGPLELPGGGSAFPLYERLGVDVYQAHLQWSLTAPVRPASPTAPQDPAYRWPSDLDTVVAEARARGIDVALAVVGSPAWANGGRSSEWAPSSPVDYGNFLLAASRRYPGVRFWMIWNEPNKASRFKPNAADSPVGPRAYARLLDAAYGALKARSRRNVVIGGMTWTGGEVKPRSFIRWLRLPSGQPPRIDWYGHNPFPFRFPDLRAGTIAGGWRDFSDLDVFSREVRGELGRGSARPKLWLAEYTVQSDHASQDFEFFVSAAGQARWLRAAYRIADRLRSVAGLGWLTLLDEPDAPGSRNFGLLRVTGSAKPALAAFRSAPSRRHRPVVRAPKRVRAGAGGFTVRIRPRARGRVRVALLRRGRTIARRSRRARRGRLLRVRLPGPSEPGRYVVVVRASRGERVTRRVSVRG